MKIINPLICLYCCTLILFIGCGEDYDEASLYVGTVDTGSKQSVRDFYHAYYVPDLGIPMNWSGSVGANDPGKTSTEHRNAVVRRVNYHRVLCGLPQTGLNLAQSEKCQQAALMFSANDQLSHYPPDTWLCYTADGAEAAGKSNIYLGVAGPPAIDGYISDPGAGNSAVGHRRWILYPPLSEVGTGCVDTSGSYRKANALWVVGNTTTRPANPEYVAWPSPGYFPRQHLPGTTSQRWSFSVAGADWSSAEITMTRGASAVSIIMEPVDNAGYGDRTIVWKPTGGDSSGFSGPEDVWSVSVSGVEVGGQTKEYTYTVTVFDPEE